MSLVLPPRVRLRAARPSDASALQVLLALEGGAGLPPGSSLSRCRRFLREARAQARVRRAFHFVVEVRSTGRLAGWIALLEIDWDRREAEAGTWLAPQWRGRGVNSQAKRLLLDHAFATLGLERLRMYATPENIRSIHALENLGATRDGQSPALPAGIVPFSIWRDDDQVI
ncbi:MAG: GNAT family N-acetyltransferase [Candidatus Wallbacteria bacterium]|nr:GNAT family N-acetyltransferase [Candidatus Wallbacteria bacterium]